MILSVLHVGQSLFSVYGLFNSYIAITNLQKYEEKTKKAAEWSGAAEEQLHRTRTTQGSAALSILASALTSFVLATAHSHIPYAPRILASPALLILMLFARAHFSNFWNHKAKVPMVDSYNEAISRSTELLKIMLWLEYSWVGTSLVAGLYGY